MRRKRNPYIRIIEAAEHGRGVALSWEEVSFMARDDAIKQVAQNTLDGDLVDGGFFTIDAEGFHRKGRT